MSLYVHIPYCERLCYYCACTKEIVPPDKHRAADPGDTFLDALETEARLLADLVGPGTVAQVHLGGGSPTFLTSAQLTRLWTVLTRGFALAPDAEVAIEIDPRITRREQLETLRGLGYNRVSLGVQDFDPTVQKAVNRLQPFEQVERCVGWCRELGFGSVNFDLIYGLPFQTLESMSATLDQTLVLRPDRVAFYRLAVIPEIFRWQNAFRHADLPAGEEALELSLLGINRFLEAGYEFIGLDHFARPDEPLARARRDGSVRRTFQGMTTGRALDVIGLGPSAISQLDDAFAQNHKASTAWTAAVDQGLATERGLHLSDDDRLRRELLQQLYGHGVVEKAPLERQFDIVFDDYFADELDRLGELADDAVVELDGRRILLTTPLGRLLVRVAAAVFDRYLPKTAYREGLPEQLASRVG